MQRKALLCLNRRLEAETLNQPVLVIERTKLFQYLKQFRGRLEVPDPEQLLLERSEEAFDTAVAFRFSYECRLRLNPLEDEFALEVVAHELSAMITGESKFFSSTSLESSEVLMDTLAEGFQDLEARGSLDGMNDHTLDRRRG